MTLETIIKNQIEKLKNELDSEELTFGEIFFNNGRCQILSQSTQIFEIIVELDEMTSEVYALRIDSNDLMEPFNGNSLEDWDRYSYACLLQVDNELHLLDSKDSVVEHKKYTREGMMRRVLNERIARAAKAEYKIKWADNIYGDHVLTNENGVKYKVFLRDFENETGYSNSLDAEFNKLATTKHIMYAFRALKENRSLYRRLRKSFPFIEIYINPLNDEKISWIYPG